MTRRYELQRYCTYSEENPNAGMYGVHEWHRLEKKGQNGYGTRRLFKRTSLTAWPSATGAESR
jgi:hypothetical protein